jgi:hypothetical protein
MPEEKQYPSVPQQGKNLAEFAWNVIKQSLREGTPLQVSDEIYQQRLEICKNCEWYDEEQIRCKNCGCWLENKARWGMDSCPIGKWAESNDTWIKEKFDELVKDLDNKEETN